MNRKIRRAFPALVLLQGLHSVEEFTGHLWLVFPPAKFITGLISSDLRTGFLIINSGLFLFGLWCWFFPVRKNDRSAGGFIRFWIIIELINGTGHPLWSLYRGSYEPGLITALLLLITAVYLAFLLLKSGRDSNGV